jgi:hypothetical protein
VIEADWPYFVRWSEQRRKFEWGERPKDLEGCGSIRARDWRRHRWLAGYVSPLDRARRLARLLKDPSIRTQTRLAQVVGLDRERVVRLLNVLKLPEPILRALEERKGDPAFTAFFHEKRLRQIHALKDQENRLLAFEQMLRHFEAKR